jgi:CBS domain containing-hemolysin-like protein
MTELLYPSAAIIFLVLMNGLFVAAEFAIIGVRPSRIKQLVEEGNTTAAHVLQILQKPGQADRYIATAQLGITLASLGLGMYAEPVIAHLLEVPLHDRLGLDGAIVHTIAFVIALLFISYLHVVLGEMVPKSIALQDSEKAVLALNGPMMLAGTVFSIPVTVLNQIGVLLMKLMGIRLASESSRGYTPDELEMIVSESQIGGLLEQREQGILSNIFDFGDRQVVDVMTPRPRIQSLPTTATAEDVIGLIPSTHYNRIPVYAGGIDNIIGVLHLKDFIRQQISGQPFRLTDLIRRVLFVPESLEVEKLLASFRKEHLHMAIVIDEHGGTLGLVTLEDLIEEIFGEVIDEFDLKAEDPLVVTGPGLLTASGEVILDDIEEYVSLGDHNHAVNTIGGLVMAELGRLAVKGDELRVGNATIRVEEVEGHTVRRVSIRYPMEG